MRAVIINRDYWWSHNGEASTKATVGIDGLDEEDLLFLVDFLNRNNAILRIRALDSADRGETTKIVDSIRQVGVSEGREKIKAKDDKKYDVQVGSIDSLEL